MASLSELKAEALRGASLRVDAKSFSATELTWLARDVQTGRDKTGRGELTIFNADALERHERGSIEREFADVTFEF